MSLNDSEDTTIYKVVVNHEEQYSIWPEHKISPAGWREVGKTGLKADCLAYIKEAWTDMRPLSLRKAMEELAKNPTLPRPEPEKNTQEEKSLVERLCERVHPVEAGLRPEKSVKAFKEALDRSYVHIKFTDTRGGTELGVKLDGDGCDFSKANFAAGTGSVHVEGGLTLNYVKVRCVADIALDTLSGGGRLVRVEA